MSQPLGRLHNVAVREIWAHEANGFTPWLARPENISLLGKALGFEEIEVEATERDVGDFSADIVARADGASVLIENQLEATDHKHLGQLLTYLAGLDDAVKTVWLSTEFREEHRAAIDWLNTNTTENFDFFGVEIELLKIGDSLVAPRFNVVAKPNDWSRNVRSTARQVSEAPLLECHRVRLAYWASFAEFLKQHGSTFKIRRRNKSNCYDFPIGRSRFVIRATISTEKERVGVELYIYGDVDKAAFRALVGQKDAIEDEIGERLDWQELPANKACRIGLYRLGVDC
jgi:hypothetical protein